MKTLSVSEFDQLKGAYQGLGVVARADLERFCKANETTVVIGDRDLSYILEGRRQVWLRISDFLILAPEDLRAKYTMELVEPGPQT